jgi:hypothetical protein
MQIYAKELGLLTPFSSHNINFTFFGTPRYASRNSGGCLRKSFFFLFIFSQFLVSAPLALADLKAVSYLDQNWSEPDRQKFYFTPQGSHLMPYDWAMQLLNPRDLNYFFRGDALEKYGYIGQAPSTENPDGLPIGFTKDAMRGRNYIGMNCAACHTSNIQVGAQNIRIDGGATQADFQTFVREMDAASERTLQEPALFEIFARGVLGASYSELESQKLRVDFMNYVSERKSWQDLNQTSMEYGPGRNDAFGVIFNQVLSKSLGIPENRREPDAPVSYPVLWDTNQHDFVQWVGIASNAPDKGGALSRNIGQVLGVFGHVDTIRQTRILNGYCSSAKRSNLDALEELSKSLWSPVWPENKLGPLDRVQMARGKEIYQARCVGCHSEIDRTDPLRAITAKMIPVAHLGTDPKVAENAGNRTALTGSLAGEQLELISGRELAAEEPASLLLKHVVAGSLAGTISPISCGDEIETNTITILMSWRRIFHRAISNLCDPAEKDPDLSFEERLAAQREAVGKYKARPLNGVWASAPYLHNGSVKNLYEMLLPASARSTKFRVGCTNFDANKVGFDCDGDATKFEFDTSIPGNSNRGHEFAASLSEEDRRALLTYLKSL